MGEVEIVNKDNYLNMDIHTTRNLELFETLRDALVRVPRINSKEESNSENISIENFTIDVKELADTDSIDKIVRTVKQSIYKDATSGNNMKINRR